MHSYFLQMTIQNVCHRYLSIRVNHSIVAFSSWSMLYLHTRHRNSNKFKTLCQKLASVFVREQGNSSTRQPIDTVFGDNSSTQLKTTHRHFLKTIHRHIIILQLYPS